MLRNEDIQLRDMLVERGRLNCGMTEYDFLRKRTQEVTLSRGVIYLVMQESGTTINSIARLFGKNHATIISALKQIRGYIALGYTDAIETYENTKCYVTGTDYAGE